MADRVKPTRRYDSSRRREQADATRLEILQAAQRLFERDGFSATTMAAVAAEARVAAKTVYLAFETKSGLLRALWNLLLRGDQDDVPMQERRWYLEILGEPDPEHQLRLMAQNSRVVKLRAGSLMKVIRDAASADADIAALWRRIGVQFYEHQRGVVGVLHERGHLLAGLDVQAATDRLWTLNHPDLWHLLVGERGWTAEAYEQWCADAACAQLLGR